MWEMNNQDHVIVAPSIFWYGMSQDDPAEWFADRYADVKCSTGEPDLWDDQRIQALAFLRDGCVGDIVEVLTEAAIEYGSITNGGWEMYIDGWTTVPWCTDEQRHGWYEGDNEHMGDIFRSTHGRI